MLIEQLAEIVRGGPDRRKGGRDWETKKREKESKKAWRGGDSLHRNFLEALQTTP